MLVNGVMRFEFCTRLRNPVVQGGKASAEVKRSEFIGHLRQIPFCKCNLGGSRSNAKLQNAVGRKGFPQKLVYALDGEAPA
jgi:hypothetical protein